MERLHFSHMTENDLVMLSDDGTEYQVAIDDSLRSAIKRTAGQPQPGANLPSPREIQELVRNGKSIAEICELTGGQEDYVSKFAQPVLDELSHIVESAKAVRISLAGDRFSDITQIEFGALIASRLASAGATTSSWTSHRVDLGSWQVRIDFDLVDGRGAAIWTFDPRKLVLTPENEAALSLSSTESLHSNLIPKLKPVSATAISSSASSAGQRNAEGATSSIQETIAAANLKSNLLAPEVEEGSLPASTEDEENSRKSHLTVVKTAESEAEPKIEIQAAPKNDSEPDSHAGPTSQLLNEVRSKRSNTSGPNSAGSSAPSATDADLRQPGATRPLIPVEEPTPVTTSIRVVTEDQLSPAHSLHGNRAEESQLPEVEPEDVVEDEIFDGNSEPQIEVKNQATAEPKQEVKKGRPGIPSWDEIVFGTKSDDQ